MEFRILGPLEVVDQERLLPVGHGKQRALLVLLVLRAGEVVSTDALIDDLWDGRPPATAAKSVQVYVSRLRKALGEDVIVTRAPGYLLAASSAEIDASRVATLADDARRQPPLDAAATLREALALWRGPVLADVARESFAHADIARLDELHLVVLEDRIEADLALGRHAQLVGELEALVQRHPYRERLRGQLMLALYRAGRQAEALDTYRDARTALASELGLEPGPILRELERQILRQDPSLAPPAAAESGDESRATAGNRSRHRVALLVGIALLAVAASATAVAYALVNRGSTASLVAEPNSVAVIDPETDGVVATVPVAERPTSIAIHGNDVWVLHPDRRTLSRLDRSTRTVLGTIGLGGAPSDIVAAPRGAWVSDARAATLTLIDSERLAAVKVISTRKRPLAQSRPDAGVLAIGLGSIWFASGDATIARVDLRTGRVVARIRGVATEESLGGIAVTQGAVWVAGPYQDSPLTRIDPRRNKVVATIALQKFRSNGIAVAGRAVWVSDVGSDHVWRIDPSRNAPVGTTKVGVAPLGVASGAGWLWVANSGDGTVSRIDPISGRVVGTIAVGGSPNAIVAVDDSIWVTVD